MLPNHFDDLGHLREVEVATIEFGNVTRNYTYDAAGTPSVGRWRAGARNGEIFSLGGKKKGAVATFWNPRGICRRSAPLPVPRGGVPFGAAAGALEAPDDALEQQGLRRWERPLEGPPDPGPKPPTVPAIPPWNHFSAGSPAPK